MAVVQNTKWNTRGPDIRIPCTTSTLTTDINEDSCLPCISVPHKIPLLVLLTACCIHFFRDCLIKIQPPCFILISSSPTRSYNQLKPLVRWTVLQNYMQINLKPPACTQAYNACRCVCSPDEMRDACDMPACRTQCFKRSIFICFAHHLLQI